MEKNLVASARNGDKDAYGRLVNAHSGRVFAICLGMLAETPIRVASSPSAWACSPTATMPKTCRSRHS